MALLQNQIQRVRSLLCVQLNHFREAISKSLADAIPSPRVLHDQYLYAKADPARIHLIVWLHIFGARFYSLPSNNMFIQANSGDPGAIGSGRPSDYVRTMVFIFQPLSRTRIDTWLQKPYFVRIVERPYVSYTPSDDG